MNKINLINPTDPGGRIISLDLLRGIAVLGILIMNIQSFSMPGVAYINPTTYGDLTGLNKGVWIFSHIIANGKFMAIFSILFGAGIQLFTNNAETREKNSAALHYRRMGWLLVIGLIHSYLLWTGDILVGYSLCGMLVYPLRNIKPVRLVWLSMALFMVPVVIHIAAFLSLPLWPRQMVDSANSSWSPDEQVIRHYLDVYRGGWLEQMSFRVQGSFSNQTRHFIIQTFWRATALMLLGMALYKWKILSAGRTKSFYQKMSLAALLPGLLLSVLSVVLSFRTNWNMEYSRFLGTSMNYIGSLGMALGYIGMIMLISKSTKGAKVKKLFASVGKMALTDYILMTLLATFIFYGDGLGLFGSVDRTGQVLIVLGIWIVLVAFSNLWLRYFRFGPLEKLWRNLTYWGLKQQRTLVSDKPVKSG
jgi:uncharacterized protein